jgi:uncharacterized membrane protein (DUF4010 family)
MKGEITTHLLGLSLSKSYLVMLMRLGLALALGVFIGLEREKRGKEAGVRTFAFAALIGCMGSFLGEAYALTSLALLGLLTFFLNWEKTREGAPAELTTSASFFVVGFVGILCGMGYTFLPVAVGITTAALLAWKQPLTGFSLGLTEVELRSAILLAILMFIIYPVLPVHSIDPWHLIQPRTYWGAVILVAMLGFGNYILWRLYGERGIELTGFLGGLVNSVLITTELSQKVRDVGEAMEEPAYRGILFATGAKLIRNSILLGILSFASLTSCALVLGTMLLASLGFALIRRDKKEETAIAVPPLKIDTPFSLWGAGKIGGLFVGLQVAGVLAQRFLGSAGFLAVSFVGGIASSAVVAASAGISAAHGKITPVVAGNAVVLAALSSILFSLILTARIARKKKFVISLLFALGSIVLIGFLGFVLKKIVY